MNKTVFTTLAVLSSINLSTYAATIVVDNADFSSLVDAGTATSWAEVEAGGGSIYYDPSEASAPDFRAYIMSSGSSSDPDFKAIIQNLSTFNGGLNASTYTNYTISFDAGFRDDLGQTGTVNMRVALVDLGADGIYQSSDSILDSATFTRSGDGTPMDMSAEVANLTIASASTNDIGLVFLNENTGTTFQQTATIDNISVVAVPEPTSSAMFGLAGLALILRRRR
ncbi:PEP-CTERM protein-sorting domain-containing protein/MYXO-CTERM domain-containing protein [Rubritalea squalenifaciens DSM 18772]|uniref:PEP-CTERM protein-sorting domain-containing protein/MYXO-CTERM domain-containing protein n=1 Tax=Rubritalea squalenifaciens DSM 18772 TaxID=1123071 RepID=A0A1M6DPB3_9BACT|nr:PEP-CTERM sorting domain-containing protein [Rubritalea squalenifaciens]SHI74969.1 PEP-CTERM protein-sorting domain-containing protein/MYXO-CTERM domain-containing protein [Rubritalea squalenifaciens DSM 18772]